MFLSSISLEDLIFHAKITYYGSLIKSELWKANEIDVLHALNKFFQISDRKASSLVYINKLDSNQAFWFDVVTGFNFFQFVLMEVDVSNLS